ncbi:MAG: hopanoid C-3 methylase HpnR, partial [Paraburkholderia sp.]
NLQLADHARAVRYEMTPPPRISGESQIDMKTIYIHGPAGRKGRKIDDATEKFVDETRTGTE